MERPPLIHAYRWVTRYFGAAATVAFCIRHVPVFEQVLAGDTLLADGMLVGLGAVLLFSRHYPRRPTMLLALGVLLGAVTGVMALTRFHADASPALLGLALVFAGLSVAVQAGASLRPPVQGLWATGFGFVVLAGALGGFRLDSRSLVALVAAMVVSPLLVLRSSVATADPLVGAFGVIGRRR